MNKGTLRKRKKLSELKLEFTLYYNLGEQSLSFKYFRDFSKMHTTYAQTAFWQFLSHELDVLFTLHHNSAKENYFAFNICHYL